MVPPRVVALLTANRVVPAAREGGCFSIEGIYNVLKLTTFPHPRTLECYLALTDGYDGTGTKLHLVDDEIMTIASVDVDIDFSNPLETQERRVPFPVTFPREGVYHLQVEWRGQVLFERRLTIRQV